MRARGKTNLETQVAGHVALWRSLPASIRNIVVVRDTPLSSAQSLLCVERAFKARREAGRRCARSRARALQLDAGIVAARRLGSSRVHAIDLSSFFCDARLCFAVIGGAHVYKDFDHMTSAFSRSLGPYLLRSYDKVVKDDAGGGRHPLEGLLPDERAAAECLIAERLAASAAGGFENVSPERRERAMACRAALEQRVAELEAAGLTGERNRAGRHKLILRVLNT